jgi:GNAT superfamily N-acetyltransferase
LQNLANLELFALSFSRILAANDRKTMANCSIRKATLEDFEAAYGIVTEYYEAAEVLARDTKDGFRAAYFGERSGFWLALLDRKVVGCVALREWNRAEHSGEIKRMYVQAACRKLGIAQALLNALESFAAEAGHKWLYLDSARGMDAAIRFYQKNGYDPCPRYNDNPQAIVFLCKGIA